MSNYSEIQEMFLMNISVNEASDKSGSGIEQKVYDKTRNFLDAYHLSNWDIVWGPAVYRVIPKSKPDQIMFLAFDKSTSRYFLSVSGTNPYSLLNWIEDLDVSTTLQWPWNNAGDTVQIASGSKLALDVLIGMKTNARVNGKTIGSPISLTDYLKSSLTSSEANSFSLITGGHSLGGAISPLCALWLKDNQIEWDPTQAIEGISSWPSAGPTTGTPGFKTYYNTRIPETHRIHNTKDVVPHAWNKTDLSAIKTLYTPEIPSSDCIDTLVDRSIAKVKDIDYVQAGTIEEKLEGTVDASIVNKDYPDAINFGIQLGYQHVDAYFELLGIPRNSDMELFDLTDWGSVVKEMAKNQTNS